MSEVDSIIEAPQRLPIPTDPQLKIDMAEALVLAHGGQYRPLGGTVECAPLTHRFTPGLYIREVFLPAQHVLSTYIHKQTHPFTILKGSVSIYREDGELIRVDAPYFGITKQGTRRFIMTHTDTVWITYHPTGLTDINELEEALFERRENIYMPDMHRISA